MMAAIAVNQLRAENISAKQIRAASRTSLRSPPAIKFGRFNARDNGVLRKLILASEDTNDAISTNNYGDYQHNENHCSGKAVYLAAPN